MVNSLAQLVLKVASPGVPDFYQGTEFWQLDLADPDNRRPVDFRARESVLDAMMPWIERVECPNPTLAACGCDTELETYVSDLVANWPDARIKMFVMACALRLRRREPLLFAEGSYQPIRAEGAEAPHLVAFARTLGTTTVIAVVPRLMNRGLPEGPQIPVGAEVWKDTRLFLSPESTGSILSSRVYRRSIEVR